MKHSAFVILVLLAHGACNSRNGQLTDTNDSPANVIIIADTTGQRAYDPANLPVDSTMLINNSLADPAHKLITDPLEGVDTVSRKNPAHGQPGHRCDVPVGAEVSTMPKTIGMSLCK